MTKVRYFVRERKIIIGRDTGDIIIPRTEQEYVLEGDALYAQKYGTGSKEELTASRIALGDDICAGDLIITVFDEYIKINGNTESYQCGLAPYLFKETPFDGFPYYKRSPRVIRRIHPETIHVKMPPRKEALSKSSLAQIIIPPLCMMAVTVFMSIFMKRGLYVIAGVCMTGVTTIFSIQRFFNEKKEIKKKNKMREQVYTDYLVKIRGYIRRQRAKEREALDYQTPGLQELERMVISYDSRFYERGEQDEDFLQVNIGYRSGGSQVCVESDKDELEMNEDELQDEAKQLVKDFESISHIPVLVNLRRSHLGIVGESGNIGNQLKYLLMQLCFFYSYHDLQIVFIGKETDEKEFSYLRWYPHLRIQAINAVAGIFRNSTRDQILGSILQIVKDRKQKIDESSKTVAFMPHFLFVVNEPRLIQDHAIMEYLGRGSKELGISIIYTTDQVSKLPENIGTVCVLDNSQTGHLALKDGVRCEEYFEVVSTKDMDVERMSRSTAALIHEKGMTSRIPESITFFEMYQINKPDELMAPARWKNHEAHKSLAVPLGVREQDNFVELDLHEKSHGPHGLVAGTTGSGKSEIVQSYILSLAANFHPYEVGFLLIDYKGGGMANLFQRLPHLLGTITNLDGAESYRAMVSIKSELARRQRIFNEYGVNHINGYHKLYNLGKAKEPIPHLFLISDEFAELKKEQPEFMKELVSTARIGRSLGIHLILATQKPSGVVDEQIWTNSRFKLCLKVQNEADSREMLKTPDAAAITQPGRAYLQVGNNEIYELFQSAYSGAAYSEEEETAEEGDRRVYLVNQLGQGQLINQDLGGSLESNQIKKTQLDVTVEYLEESFEKLNLPKVKSPWLPPLTEIMVSPIFRDIKDSVFYEELCLKISVGLEDIPGEQRQAEYEIDFLHDGHVIYFASTGYGKTVFLETLLLGLCARNSVKNFHAYIMDFGNNAMLPLKSLPHVADYITYDDVEKQQKLIRLLLKEIKLRKQMMADVMAQNFDIYNQSAEKKLEAIVVLLDNYDVVKELGIDENVFVQLARDGANLGIYLAVTASRSSVVKYALMNQIKTKIAGYNYEPMEARNIVGRSEYELPDIKGRTLVKSETINLMQVYSPVMYETGIQYNKNLLALIRQIANASTEEKAKGIAVLPEQLRLNMLPEYEVGAVSDIFLGLEKQNVKRFGILTADTPFLIVGPVRCGKSNACRMMLNQMQGFEKIYLFDGKNYELQDIGERENIAYIDGEEALNECIGALTELIEKRKVECLEKRGKLSAAQYYLTLPKYCVFIGELSDFSDFIKEDKKVVSTLMEAAEAGILVAMCGHSAHMPARNETAKLIKSAENGLILGDPGLNTAFPTFRGKELPEQIEDGILYKKGISMMIRLPKA